MLSLATRPPQVGAGASTSRLYVVSPKMIREYCGLVSSSGLRRHIRIIARLAHDLVSAIAAQTKYCIQQGSSCELPEPAKVKIDAAYVETNTPIVREQLQKAGVRLAHLLDSTLGK